MFFPLKNEPDEFYFINLESCQHLRPSVRTARYAIGLLVGVWKCLNSLLGVVIFSFLLFPSFLGGWIMLSFLPAPLIIWNAIYW